MSLSMRPKLTIIIFLNLAHMFVASAGQAQSPENNVLKGCASELEQYCSSVAPGAGRILACMKAHEDKLSEQCIASIVRAEFQINSSALILNVSAQMITHQQGSSKAAARQSG